MQSNNYTSLSWLWVAFPALLALGCGNDETASSPPGPVENPDALADTYAVTSTGRLLFFERGTGEVQRSWEVEGFVNEDEAIVGIDFRPADGALYALTTSGILYTVDTGGGGLTPKATLGPDTADTSSPFAAVDGEVFGVNFNPVADRLRVVSDTGQNLRINVDTGATTTDGDLNAGASSATAAAYSNSYSVACRTRLYVIDTATNKLFLQDPPNSGTLAEIGDLPAPEGDDTWAVLDVVTASDGRNQALALLPGEDGPTVFDVDLNNASLVNPRPISLLADESLVGVSAPPPGRTPAQAPGEILAVNVSNELVSFNRAAPGKLCTRQVIDGLEAGEDVLGIDVRPANGDVYALGSAGKMYTLDITTGRATLASTLAADPADTTNPFVSLAEAEFGIGFNPVPDRLRAVSRDGQNLRINVESGLTTTDAPLSPTSMAVTAVAYTNAFAGATATTLYAVDAQSSALARIGGDPATGGACPDDASNPNCGNVTSLGPLGVNGMSDVDGFDIDGTPNAAASALVALRIGDATSSSLYVVDLATGAASPPAGVANPTIGGGVALRELTLATNPVVTPAP